MQISVSTSINASKEAVWNTITDIDQCQTFISAIIAVEVLEKPESGLVGLKWRETREMFGKKADETMWITDAEQNTFYQTRAESHGSVYISRMELTEAAGVTTLTMSFKGEAQTLVAKILSTLMGFMIKGSMIKAVEKDLADIKQHVEQQA